jgi:hypothetical protein
MNDKFTSEEAALLLRFFEEMRICPLMKDSDKYCANVHSIIKKVHLNLYDASNVSGADAVSAKSESDLAQTANTQERSFAAAAIGANNIGHSNNGNA